MTFKPKKKVRTIKAEYFSCGRDGHFHKTEKVAIKCHDKRSKITPPFAERRERFMSAIDMYIADEKIAAIGLKLGVSRQVVNDYVFKATEIVFAHDDLLITLPDGTIGKMSWGRTSYNKNNGISTGPWPHKLFVRHVSNYQKCLRLDQIKPLAEKVIEDDDGKGWSLWRLERTKDDGFIPLCEMTRKQIKSIPTTHT